jgi:hypothetical protein
MESSLSFRVSAMILNKFTRGIVENEIDVIYELIKNSYDADADRVDLFFENIGTNNEMIRIKDNGEGMTLEDFEKKWMILKIDEESTKFRSKGGRLVTGSKGIGRFSTEFLAKEVIIISNPKDSSSRITLKIDWKKYRKENALFDAIENPLSTELNSHPNDQGLEIILKELKKDFDLEKIKLLEKQIGVLILSSIINDEKSFDVFINYPELGMYNKSIRYNIIKNLTSKIIRNDGKLKEKKY